MKRIGIVALAGVAGFRAPHPCGMECAPAMKVSRGIFLCEGLDFIRSNHRGTEMKILGSLALIALVSSPVFAVDTADTTQWLDAPGPGYRAMSGRGTTLSTEVQEFKIAPKLDLLSTQIFLSPVDDLPLEKRVRAMEFLNAPKVEFAQP
jgi:hypothetical protein